MANKEKLADHLTKEIEVFSTNIMNFRIRSSFTVWIGPYILLGSLIVASKGNWEIHWGKYEILAAILAGFSYFALGVMGGLIEMGVWRKINVWRDCIVDTLDVSEEQSKKLKSDIKNEVIVKKVVYFYIVAFIFMAASFGAMVFIADSVYVKTPSQATMENHGS